MAKRLVVFKILFLVLIAHQSLILIKTQEDFGDGKSAAPTSGKFDNSSNPQETNNEFSNDNNNNKVNEEDSARAETALIVDPDEPGSTEPEEAPPLGRRAGELVAASELGLSGAPPPQIQDSSRTTTSSTTSSPAATNQAELCYLSNGGSSLTLTVNEATQVGSIIGTIEVSSHSSLKLIFVCRAKIGSLFGQINIWRCEIESRQLDIEITGFSGLLRVLLPETTTSYFMEHLSGVLCFSYVFICFKRATEFLGSRFVCFAVRKRRMSAPYGDRLNHRLPLIVAREINYLALAIGRWLPF